jgi:hypothetical protein
MPRLNFVKRARKDYPDYRIAKGDSYYWWTFRNGGKHISKEKPRRSRLTQSSFNSTLWDIEDDLQEIEAENAEDLETIVQEYIDRIMELKEETEQNLENMPEQLQESSILPERIEALNIWISELESIDLEVDEDEIKTEVKERVSSENDPIESIVATMAEERVQEKIDEILDEIKSTACGL